MAWGIRGTRIVGLADLSLSFPLLHYGALGEREMDGCLLAASFFLLGSRQTALGFLLSWGFLLRIYGLRNS